MAYSPTNSSPLAPAPQYPERISPVYEAKIAPNAPGGGGPLRFQEGLGTDSDVPREFTTGIMQGYMTAPGRTNRNAAVWIKRPEETLQERAHPGSSSWVMAPTFLGEFAYGAQSGNRGMPVYETVVRSGGYYTRMNPAYIDD